MGTFASRLPPQGATKKAIFEAIKQEYYDSKEWAQQQNFVWKDKINGVFSTQLCWKTMKEIFDRGTDDFEQKREMAKNVWRDIVRVNFEVMDAWCHRRPLPRVHCLVTEQRRDAQRGLGGAKERLCSCLCIFKPWPVFVMDAADGLENTILGWRHSWRHRVEETTCRCFWVDEPTWCVTVGGAIQEEAIQQFA